jgi:hypothetical protein
MSAGIFHLKIEQGADFEESFQFLDDAEEPLDFTDCTARMQIRETLSDAESLLSLTTENGRLIVDEPSGTITMQLTATTTASLASGGVYDLEAVFPDGEVQRLLKGLAALDKEVTR